jgi:hypothetical protein
MKRVDVTVRLGKTLFTAEQQVLWSEGKSKYLRQIILKMVSSIMPLIEIFYHSFEALITIFCINFKRLYIKELVF